ncbi:MAG: aldose 1-epimerase family protein [Lachnospiraceae bacterium]
MAENRKIENEKLIVEVCDHGAELCRIYDKKEQREVLWDANPKYWARYAPILFPNVGKHYLNEYRHEGNVYKTSQHGFARDCDFELEQQTEDKIVHILKANEKTKEIYPFDFELEVTHTIEENAILVGWKVRNKGETPLYFTIGGHPAFRVPILEGTKQTDYYLKFEENDSVSYYLLDEKTGTAMVDKTIELPLKDGYYQVTDGMFEKDALIFVNDAVTKASICLPDKRPYVTVEAIGFPNYGIWAAKNNAPFICLEPWFGRCDDTGYTGEMKEKPGIQTALPKEEWSASYRILIHD